MKSPRAGILLLADHVFGAKGGTEQHLLFLQSRLPEALFRVHFALLSVDEETRGVPFPVEPRLLGLGCRGGLRGALQRLGRLVRLIRSAEIDVVHTFNQASESYASLAVRLARRGVVLGSRRNVGYWHTPATLRRARRLRRWKTEYVANCAAARDFAVTREGIASDRVTVIFNPAPQERLADGRQNTPSRESLGVLPGEQVVVMIGTVRPVKDYATYLRAARRVLDRYPKTRFLSIGGDEPDYLAEMRAMAGSLGIVGQFTWAGPVENPLSVLSHCDVGVLSSESEGCSNALLEYAVAGIPAVTTDVGGNRELVEDGVSGLIVPPHSPEILADKICRLLGDRELRLALGSQAAARAAALFPEERIVEQYCQLYLRLAGKTDSERPLSCRH